MRSSHKTDLEVALERLSSETFERLRAIKAFSRRPEPYNSVRLGETTITDLAMMELCRLGFARSIFIETPLTKRPAGELILSGGLVQGIRDGFGWQFRQRNST